MKLLRQILSETFQYSSHQSVDELKADMQQLFEKTAGFDFSVNLYGEFTSVDSFEIAPKWQFIYITGFENNKVATINGTLFRNDIGQTQISFTVSPNSVFPIFFFMFPLIGIIALVNSWEGNRYVALSVGLSFIFLVPIFMFLLGYFSKEALKNRFVKTFELQPLNDLF